ncbi:hypothetical protein CASFOL_004081 [Castilleja foliolosa]|uniref:Uncharacterized protein n=1 Tax=Castilleja foliolosa TaxID=1961234 RepID=A0ABD3EMT0_9LAMI
MNEVALNGRRRCGEGQQAGGNLVQGGIWTASRAMVLDGAATDSINRPIISI